MRRCEYDGSHNVRRSTLPDDHLSRRRPWRRRTRLDSGIFRSPVVTKALGTAVESAVGAHIESLEDGVST